VLGRVVPVKEGSVARSARFYLDGPALLVRDRERRPVVNLRDHYDTIVMLLRSHPMGVNPLLRAAPRDAHADRREVRLVPHDVSQLPPDRSAIDRRKDFLQRTGRR
jgi:hypothetical protein